MNLIEKNLGIIEACLQNNTYQAIETDRFELKDLSAGWGNDWYRSVCAFLNTNGGVIVIGIREPKGQPKSYKFTGYDNTQSNENHLKQELPKKFTDKVGNPIDVTPYISKFEILDFWMGKVAIVYVEEMRVDTKFAYYEGKAYIRKLTGDHPLSEVEIERYEEAKRDIVQNQELEIIKTASLDNLSVDILNQYILQFNSGKKRGETLKADIQTALPFLIKEGLVSTLEHKVTLLGMLVCGREPEYHLGGRCQADCYVIFPQSAKVADDREIIQDNIIELIERTYKFIWRNIRVGIAFTNGGAADPEYPEALIRESINNAFAHRDYTSEKFIIIEIHPQENLLIRNPGMFERRQRINLDTENGKIRRIIPFQVARNPKLTHLLKSFRYWEGKGRGLTSLIDACLDNEIDVPYYMLLQEEIRLFIPKGKVYDEEMEFWLHSFSGYIDRKIKRKLTSEEQILMSFFKKSEALNRLERYTVLITTDNNHSNTIATLEENGLIFKNPQSPELYPIYQIDKNLLRTNFSEELQAIFGKDWSLLKSDYQEVLQAIYLHHTFGNNTEIVSANSIGSYIYIYKNKKVIDLNDFENFKRKVRNIFNQLEAKKIIIRKDGKTKSQGGKPNFELNTSYQTSQDLFSNQQN